MSKQVRLPPRAVGVVAVLPMLMALLVLVGLAMSSSAFVVRETEQVVLIQFGKPVGEPIVEAGLYFRIPFIQEVRRFDRRIKAWDGDPNQIPTKGREFISVDTTARWRIVDPLLFLRSVRDESGARTRLNDIIDSVVRDQVSATDLVEIVRSKDWEVPGEEVLDAVVDDEDAAQLTKKVRHGREEVTLAILNGARDVVADYGIELVDVQIKRVNYIPSVREQVYRRMISERQRIAEEFRSEGQGASAEILGRTRRELAEIRSVAERDAAMVRGNADAEATRIYNEAYSANAEFYAFHRTLESYGRTVDGKTTLLLGTDSDYFRFLRTTTGR